jgi:protocatechuate 3,4-dioxygenase, beta subunit
MKISRRKTLGLGLGFITIVPPSALWFLAKLSMAQTSKPNLKLNLKPTPQDTEGPYYPKTWEGDVDNDLTTVNGKKYAGGIPMALHGIVKNNTGEILNNAQVEIWQIDADGEYRHPDFGGEGPAERGFQGYGRVQADDKGHYAFKTVQPIGYGGRPPHVHFKVLAEGHVTLLTEMYFAGNNSEGGLYQRLFGGFSKERDLLTVSPKTTRIGAVDALDAEFNIVLARVPQ